MIMSKRKVQIVINNVPYSFVTDESDEHLNTAARSVDELLRSILQAGVPEVSNAAVLVALQLASRALKLEERQQRQDEENRRLVEKIERESLLLASFS